MSGAFAWLYPLVALAACVAAVGAYASEGRAWSAAICALCLGAVMLLSGFGKGHRYANDRIERAGYAIEWGDGRVIIGIAPTPQPTRVRWLDTPAPTTGAGE